MVRPPHAQQQRCPQPRGGLGLDVAEQLVHRLTNEVNLRCDEGLFLTGQRPAGNDAVDDGLQCSQVLLGAAEDDEVPAGGHAASRRVKEGRRSAVVAGEGGRHGGV
jgi:hypothetical protein